MKKLVIAHEMEAELLRECIRTGLPPIVIHLDQFERAMLPFECRCVKKVVFRFGASEAGAWQHLGDVLVVPSRLNANELVRSGSSARGRLVIRSAYESLLRVAAVYGWSTTAIEAAYSQLEDGGFAPSGIYGKTVLSPARECKAVVRWRCDQKLQSAIAFEGVEGQKEVPFAVLPPTLTSLESNVRSIAWEDEKTVRVLHQNREDHWSVSKTGAPARFFSRRAEEGNAHIQYVVATMYLEGNQVVPDREEGLRWLERAARCGYSRAQARLAAEGLSR